MARLTRAQQQERTRATVLAAARSEFVEHGYASAKVDRIAERAELTRGAVYSNYAGKRALYLAVLVADVEASSGPVEPAVGLRGVLGAFARVRLERLPLSGDAPGAGNLALRSLAGVVDDDRARTALAALVPLEGLLLALALESAEGGPGRRARLAALVLTTLRGAFALAEDTPTAVEPFDVVAACTHLAELPLPEETEPPHLPFVEPARPVEGAWHAPRGLVDEITGQSVDVGRDGVLAVLGASRLGAAAEAVRWARRRDEVTLVVVTDDPAETGRLVRLRVVDLVRCLRRVLDADTLPRVRVVLDDDAVVATALGLDAVDDRTECAVRVRAGTVVARADGPGAGYAAATFSSTTW